MAHLEFCTGDHPPISIGDKVVIGRAEGASDVVIHDKRLSRQHIAVRKEGDGFVVEDLASRNGTKVNDKPVKLAPLRDGDEVSLGGLLLRFHLSDSGVEPTFDSVMGSASRGHLSAKADAESSPDHARDLPRIKLVRGTIKNVLTVLDHMPFTLGRKSSNNLPLDDDDKASGVHARFERDERGRIFLQDLNSTNGIRVNGKHVDRAELEDGARLQIGSQLFRFDMPRAADRKERHVKPEPGIDDIKLDDAPDIDLEAPASGLRLEDEPVGRRESSPSSGASVGAASVSELKLDDAPDIDLEASGAQQAERDPAAEKKVADETKNEAERLAETAIEAPRTGRGKLLVRILEVFMVLIAAAAVAVFVILSDNVSIPGTNGSGGGGKPLGNPGKLTAYHSFESDGRPENEGVIDGWLPVQNAEVDDVGGAFADPVGGRQVMQVRRYRDSRARTLWVNKRRFPASPGGLETAVWTRMPDGGGCAFFAVEWFSGDEDSTPLRRDYGGFCAGYKEWTRMTHRFSVPTGATFARLGVGVTGRKGVVLFDEVSASDTPVTRTTVEAGSGPLRMTVQPDGTLLVVLRTATGELPLLAGAVVELAHALGKGRGISHHEWQASEPAVEDVNGTTALSLRVFDPDIEATRAIRISLSGTNIDIRTDGTSGSNLSGLRLSAAATDHLMPSAAAALHGGKAVHFGRDFETEGGMDVAFMDTRNTRALFTDGRFTCAGQGMSFFGANGKLSIDFRLRDDGAAYDKLLSACKRLDDAALIAPADAARMEAALRLAADYPWETDGLQCARDTVHACAAWYRIKHVELAEIVGRQGTLTGTEDLFLRAVDRASALHTELAQFLPAWRQILAAPSGESVLDRLTLSPALPLAFRAAGASIAADVRSFDDTLAVLRDTARTGESRALVLHAERQEIDARPLLRSALDHLDSAELTQAELKLRAIVRKYPLSYAAAQARRHLLDDVAARMVSDCEQHRRDRLTRMAGEASARGYDIVDFVIAGRIAAEKIEQLRGITFIEVNAWNKFENATAAKALELKRRLGG